MSVFNYWNKRDRRKSVSSLLIVLMLLSLLPSGVVAAVPVASVTVTPETATISVGAAQQLTATVAPADATNKDVTWSSGNTAIATISETGLVTGVAAGSATITATTVDGGRTATSVITVEVPITFPDPNLESAIREALRLGPDKDIYSSDLARLRTLNAHHRGISDLTGLEYCTNLTSLFLGMNQITDISPLAGLTCLNGLFLFSNQITDISPLAGLTNLTQLNLSSNQITNLSPLTGLTSLTWLHFSSNQISDLSPLAGLTSLTWLHFSHNQITAISPLAGLTNLTSLYPYANQISDLSPLGGLTSLTLLHFSSNRISDISPLAGLTNLTSLVLGNNQISDLSPLAGLTNLTSLSLWWNQISDLSPLGRLTNLTSLSLDSNQISDISPLVENVGLSQGDWVQLQRNPLSEESLSTHIPLLVARGVQVVYDAPAVAIPVTGVSVSPGTLTLNVGDAGRLTAAIAPANATNKNATWSSSAPTVATVDATGLVTGVAAGTATIIVTTVDGGLTAISAITVVLPAGGIIAGRITDPDGAGVPNAMVIVWDQATGFGRSTDADGNYTTTSLAPGIYEIEVRSPQGVPLAQTRIPGIEVTAGATTIRDVALVAGGLISGRVTGPDGAGVPNAAIFARVQGTTAWVHGARTDANGNYTTIGLAPGTYDVRVSPPLGVAQARAFGIVVEVGATATVDFSLEVGGIISGRVTDPAGNGVPNAWIDVWDQATGVLAGRALTGANGNYTTAGLALGTYELGVSPPQGVNLAQARITDVVVTAGAITTVNVSLTATVPAPSVIAVTGITVAPTAATIYVGATEQLAATVAPIDATNQNVTWTSGNTAVASVDTNGLVTGVAAGTATITATTADGSLMASSVITVVLPATTVEVNSGNQITLAPGATLSAIPVVIKGIPDLGPNNGVGAFTFDLSWNPAVIHVQRISSASIVGFSTLAGSLNKVEGKVRFTGFSIGSVLTGDTTVATLDISALGALGTSASIGVDIIDLVDKDGVAIPAAPVGALVRIAVSVTGVTVTPETATITVGATEQLAATVAPVDATNKDVAWASSNTAVATVDATGLVTGVAAGTATITATTADGGFTAGSVITVAVPVTSVTVTPETATITVGATEQLSASVAPVDATNQDVTWASSNTAVATVDATGLVTGVAAGTATITATTADGGFTATGTITVVVPVTGVTVTPTATTVDVGAVQQFTATVVPTNATNQNVTWTSSNTAVATVDATGLVTGVAAGTATITVTTADGGFKGTSVITVVPHIAETGISQSLDDNGTVVIPVKVIRVKDPTGTTVDMPGGLGSFEAKVTSLGSGIQLLAVRGTDYFPNLVFNPTTGKFAAILAPAPEQPDNTEVARLVLRLTGSAKESHTLTVAFQEIVAAETGISVPEEQTNSLTFRRGDANGNGSVNIVDAMFIAQKVVGSRGLDTVNALNAASVRHDGVSGDKINIVDAMFIAQYVVGLRDASYNLVQ